MAFKGKVLHVGSGTCGLPDWVGECEEVRFDINPDVNPDIIGDILDMGEIGKYSVVFSVHVLEHLYHDEVQKALSEFMRVLEDDGAVIIFVPDLEDIRATDDLIYNSEAGPVTGLDMIYGMAKLVKDSRYMAHHTGFTKASLEKELIKAGFSNVSVQRVSTFNLFGVGTKRAA
jgi:hypothetical protein